MFPYKQKVLAYTCLLYGEHVKFLGSFFCILKPNKRSHIIRTNVLYEVITA